MNKVINARNTKIAQKVFELTLKNLCDVQEYAHCYTREQKLAVLKEMYKILTVSIKFVTDQVTALGGDIYSL